MAGLSPSQKAGLHLLFFLRFMQLGAVTITGFIYCYLVWHYNNHYCAYHPRFCTAEERAWVKVPWEYKFVITACTLTFLESYISTASSLLQQQMPNYRRLLCTTTPVVAVFGLSCWAIFKNPYTSMNYRFFYPHWRSWKSNVEVQNLAIVMDGLVSLSIAVGLTALIFLMSAIVVISQIKREKRIMLPVEPAAVEHDDEVKDTSEQDECLIPV